MEIEGLFEEVTFGPRLEGQEGLFLCREDRRAVSHWYGAFSPVLPLVCSPWTNSGFLYFFSVLFILDYFFG